MDKALNFQSIMMTLQEFWAARDCLIWQPYYSQVGAGTMNPATFLRVLGPEPWNVAYVEPSIRPDDGRYGDNPNRLQQFYQFQVILKPDPGNPQEIYLESLQALGVVPLKHDIRFVEDNWQQPAIGAWGLGWEVWLDGQEITQFTYFQQCGGQELNPVSVEITYGLERIAMTLQGVRHFKDIQWSPERTYGDVNLMGEREHSAYYFDIADVDRVRKMYELYEQEATRAIEAGLVLPAHDYVLRTSHAFNILDTRGAVGVTERQALFGRTRELARRVAEIYVSQRQTAEFPWLTEGAEREPNAVTENILDETDTEAEPFLLEIGTEELPPSDLQSALSQLTTSVPVLLADLRLSHGGIKVLGTSRRLGVSVKNLSTRQPDLAQTVKGPPADRAFDAEGNPTQAAMGFARGKGVEVSELCVETIDGGDYVVAHIEAQGLPASVVLRDALPDLVGEIRFNKSMRWNESGVAFSRPIRWLLAMHGNRVIPFKYAGYLSGSMTQGLRFEEPSRINIASVEDYFEKISSQGIILDPAARKAEIIGQAERLAEEIGVVLPDDPELLEEVSNMVEKPTVFRGQFDKSYLEILPPEVLISVMKKHQRYFVVEDANGNLAPYFLGVRNGGQNFLDTVIDGNEQVILARFDDASFFIKKDLKKPLEDYVPELAPLTFQAKLGSLLDKTHRITKLVKVLGNRLELSPAEIKATHRAALLAKADLATNMVVEMTSLQGAMGRYYALQSGEDRAVAEAIFEHHLPRFANDRLPETKPGLIVGLADRLDSLVGLFTIGLAPTGTKDPFAQRRAALGICQNLITWQSQFDIAWALGEAAKGLPVEARAEDIDACLDFIQERLRGMLLDMGYRFDVVDAVLAEKGKNPYGAYLGVEALTAWVAREDWDQILPAFSRCVRITRDQKERFDVSKGLFSNPAEQALHSGIVRVEEQLRNANDVDTFLTAFVPFVPVINAFFDEVLVMVDEDEIRENRLALLQRISEFSEGIADLSRLEGF